MTGKEQQPSEAKQLVATVTADAHYSIFAEANSSMDESLISVMYLRPNPPREVAATTRAAIADTFSKVRVC